MSVTAAAYDVTGTKNMFWSMAETESTLNLNPRDAMHPMVAERPQDLNRQRLEICVNFWNIFRTEIGGIKYFNGKGDFQTVLHEYLHGTVVELQTSGTQMSGNRFLVGDNPSVANIIEYFLYKRFNEKIAVTSFSPLRVNALFDNDINNPYRTPSNCSADVFTNTQLGEIYDDAIRDGVDWMIGSDNGYYVPDIRNGDRFGITLRVKIESDQKGTETDLSIDGEYVGLNDNYKSFNIVFAHDENAPSNLTMDPSGGLVVKTSKQIKTSDAEDEKGLSLEEDLVSSVWYTVQTVGYGYNDPSTDVSGNTVGTDNNEGLGTVDVTATDSSGSTATLSTGQFPAPSEQSA